MEAMITMLLPLLAQIESSNNPNAIGDGGRAIGLYQIHNVYWTDGIEYMKVDWPYKRAYDPKYAEQVVRSYLTRYGKHYERVTGKKATLEVLARIHNGGPNGWKKKATLKYWQKIERLMDARPQLRGRTSL